MKRIVFKSIPYLLLFIVKLHNGFAQFRFISNSKIGELKSGYEKGELANTEKGTPTGNLRIIGERHDYVWTPILGTPDWVYKDSLKYNYDPIHGKLTSIEAFKFDTTTNQWYIFAKMIFSYNSSLQLSEVYEIGWNGITFENYAKEEYYYDFVGNLYEKISYEGINITDWKPERRKIYIRGSNNLVDTEIEYNWNDISSNWIFYWKTEYTYYSNQELHVMVSKKWENNQWKNFTKEVRNIDTITNKLYSLYRYDFDNFINDWKNSSLDSVSYNTIANEVHVHYNWSTTTNSWAQINRKLIFYVPTTELPSNVTFQKWISSSWKNESDEFYQYDSNENLIEIVKKKWISSSNSWENFYSLEFSYNADNYKTYSLYKEWNASTNLWEERTRSFYYYETDPHLSVENLMNESMVLYPNPANQWVFIEFSGNSNFQASDELHIKIFNLQGIMIYSASRPFQSTDNQIQLNVSNYDSGVYFVQIENRTNRLIQKMIIN